MKQAFFIIVLSMCLLNLIRLAAYLIGSDIYTLRNLKRQKTPHRWHLPTVSIVVPAFNESNTIERCLGSLINSNYPTNKYEVIVANDGSTDNTAEIVRQFKKNHKSTCKIRLINRPNKGKATALNYVIRRCAKSSLIMCLDADSYLDTDALRKGAQHFRDRNVVATSANVNILEDGTLLALTQKIEYLMGYHMKKGQDAMGIDYIIGGIGSMFRRGMMKKVSYYDTNTMTEDIDLTMKIFVHKNANQRIAFASDCIAYTEAVHTLSALLRQRFRWKYGRAQTFMKHSWIFFSTDPNYSKRITWFMMPFVLFQDFISFFEPFIVVYFIYIGVRVSSLSFMTSGIFFFGSYILFNIWSSDHLSIWERLRLTYFAMPMYILIYLTETADYYALIKSLFLMPGLKRSIEQRHFTWSSPERHKAVYNG